MSNYTETQKQQIVLSAWDKLVATGGGAVAPLARDLGVHPETLRKWMRDAGYDATFPKRNWHPEEGLPRIQAYRVVDGRVPREERENSFRNVYPEEETFSSEICIRTRWECGCEWIRSPHPDKPDTRVYCQSVRPGPHD